MENKRSGQWKGFPPSLMVSISMRPWLGIDCHKAENRDKHYKQKIIVETYRFVLDQITVIKRKKWNYNILAKSLLKVKEKT